MPGNQKLIRIEIKKWYKSAIFFALNIEDCPDYVNLMPAKKEFS